MGDLLEGPAVVSGVSRLEATMTTRLRDYETDQRDTQMKLSRVVSKSRSLVGLWLPVVLWCGVIFHLSAIPHLRFFKNALADFLFRKTGYMGEYGVLARLLARAFAESTY